jgi:protein-tyrosine-phosphatase
MKKIIFVCVHNSGRSQMAEAFLKNLAGDKVQKLMKKIQKEEI